MRTFPMGLLVAFGVLIAVLAVVVVANSSMENVLISPPHRALYRALSMTASTKRSINDLFPKRVRDKQKSELGRMLRRARRSRKPRSGRSNAGLQFRFGFVESSPRDRPRP